MDQYRSITSNNLAQIQMQIQLTDHILCYLHHIEHLVIHANFFHVDKLSPKLNRVHYANGTMNFSSLSQFHERSYKISKYQNIKISKCENELKTICDKKFSCNVFAFTTNRFPLNANRYFLFVGKLLLTTNPVLPARNGCCL